MNQNHSLLCSQNWHEHEPDWSGSEYGQLAGFGKHSREPSIPIKCTNCD